MPALKAIRWNQYTPYFNDGDPCTFSVGEVMFLVDGAAEDDGEDTPAARNNVAALLRKAI